MKTIWPTPGATPLACFRAAAAGCCGAEEEEAACRKYARFPFNAHAASCLFLNPPTKRKWPSQKRTRQMNAKAHLNYTISNRTPFKTPSPLHHAFLAATKQIFNCWPAWRCNFLFFCGGVCVAEGTTCPQHPRQKKKWSCTEAKFPASGGGLVRWNQEPSARMTLLPWCGRGHGRGALWFAPTVLVPPILAASTRWDQERIE